MNKEFKIIAENLTTRYVLETTSGATSSAVVATAEKPLGELQRRETMSVPVNQKPRQGPLKPQTGGGKHRDKKKEQKSGKEKHRKPFAEQGVAEGSGPKEKQKTPYRDINSAEYRAAAEKQKQQMAKDKAAEPGKKLLAKKGLAEDFAEDHEISMASNELQSIAADAKKLLMLVKRYSEMEGLEAWQQSKITKAADYMTSVLRSIGGEQGALDNNLNEYETHTYKDSQGNVWRVNDEGEKELIKAAPGGGYGGSRYGSRYPRRPAVTRSRGMYFYNVKPGQENDAAKAGLKQSKSGKWYSTFSNPVADKEFGPGKYWEPKSESAAEGLNEFDAQGYQQRYTLYKDDYEIEKFSDMDDAIEYAEDDRRDGDDPSAVYKIVDINKQVVWDSNPYEKPSRIQLRKPEPGLAEGSSNRLVPGKFYLLGKDKKVFTDPGAGVSGIPFEFDDSEEVLDFHRQMQMDEHDWFTPVKFDGNNFQNIGDVAEEKQKGVDGKACWKGYKRMGTKQKGGRTVDNCVKVGEEETNESGLLAWAGRKKHGADYMKKASAAARKGASQEELGRLKDKFSKAAKKEDTYMENLWAQLGNAVNEKAPEGAKYKRMAKHIKASYKGSGLDDEEIAQRAFGATWKAAKRAKK